MFSVSLDVIINSLACVFRAEIQTVTNCYFAFNTSLNFKTNNWLCIQYFVLLYLSILVI